MKDYMGNSNDGNPFNENTDGRLI